MPALFFSTAGSSHGLLAGVSGITTKVMQWYLSRPTPTALTTAQLPCHTHAVDKAPPTIGAVTGCLSSFGSRFHTVDSSSSSALRLQEASARRRTCIVSWFNPLGRRLFRQLLPHSHRHHHDAFPLSGEGSVSASAELRSASPRRQASLW